MERLTHDYVRIIVELTEMRIANQFGELRPIIAKQFRSLSFSTLLANLSAVGDSCGQHAFRIAHRPSCGCVGADDGQAEAKWGVWWALRSKRESPSRVELGARLIWQERIARQAARLIAEINKSGSAGCT
jgi:hypothetical protein